MNLASVLHRPMSEFAHALDEYTYLFRLRTEKGDVKKVTFGFADRASMAPELSFETLPMKIVRSDAYYDWFEVELHTLYQRVAYYFLLEDEKESIYYLGDCFEKTLDVGRADYFQLPFNLRNDRLEIPTWVNEAIVYNIFPDSFASEKRFLSKQSGTLLYDGKECRSLLGGTVKGITENLDYIKELGCNCVYLNPLFVASSYHKYDLLDYFHIDPTRGSDEDFKELVKTAHDMGMRVIVDGVFNHVCFEHPFFQDVLANGKESPYYDYFYDLGEKDEITFPERGKEPGYTCFAYVPEMPKTNTANPLLKEYFCKVGAYWIKEFDVDGWRLDVANEVDDEFLRAFRNAVKAEKKDALVIGEVWENASHYINGNMLDSAMNYDFRRFVGGFLAKEEPDACEFDARITNLLMRYPRQALYAQLNLLDSHDVSRFFSVCKQNLDKMELAILFQMTFIGMPSIFYGDEAGLTGESEPEYRQAMDFAGTHPLDAIYRQMIALRKNHPDLCQAPFETLEAKKGFYAYKRGKIRVYMNAGQEAITLGNLDGEVILKKNFACGILNEGGYVVMQETK